MNPSEFKYLLADLDRVLELIDKRISIEHQTTLVRAIEELEFLRNAMEDVHHEGLNGENSCATARYALGLEEE